MRWIPLQDRDETFAGEHYEASFTQGLSPIAREIPHGIQLGDVILSIDGSTVHCFEDVQQIVRLNPRIPVTIVVRRDGREQTLVVTPSPTTLTDRFGNRYHVGLLGIARPPALRKS